MSGYGTPPAAVSHGHVSSPISVPWVVLSAVLVGVGLFFVWWWVTTFDWLYFLGVAPCVLGGLMLFSRRAGLDSA
ncbi:MAG: hypothetical protein L3K10_05490 [Thermoplasmata archaeon]|nr:hypothetical protein [Thermoplasmata archaeon]